MTAILEPLYGHQTACVIITELLPLSQIEGGLMDLVLQDLENVLNVSFLKFMF